MTLSAIATMAVAAPLIPSSAVGIDQAIVVTNSGRIPILNGGLFTGTIEGSAANFWCVDPENNVYPTQSYQGNVTLLGAWGGGVNPLVQKGTATGSAWIYQGGLPALNPLQRYQAAAFLIEQTQAFQNGSDVNSDNDYQLAIWSLLDLGPSDNVSETMQAKAYRNAAVAYILGHQSFGFGNWAVVSGSVNPNGGFVNPRVQTFLTQVDTPHIETSTPEPSTYAMMGAGLLGLAMISRRKKA